MLLRQNLPARQLQLQHLNESGGYPDKTDPKFPMWEQKQKKYSKDEPRRLPFKISDVLPAHERYEPMLEVYASAHSSSNPFAEMPTAVLLEIKQGLDEKSLPSWFWATIGVDKIMQALGESEA